MLFDNVLRPYERIIINQRNKIRTLTNQLIKMCQKYITSPYRIPNLLKQISQTEQFDKFTQVLGARFVNEVNTWNKVAFANYLETGYAKNASLIYKGLSADNELKGFLAKQAEEKAKLFKSIPVDLANTIVPKIEKLTVQGATPKTVAYELAKDIPNLLEYQVKTIARTETSKTSVAITGFKSKKNNIPCYQWKASGGRQGDGRTRSSHCKMSDVIIFWENPPAPEDLFPIIGQNGQKYKNTLGHYHAGCCPNCRCLASPVIFIDDLKFPVRVYTQGMIKTMTKKDFLALYNAKVGELKAENAQKKQLNQKPIEIKKSPEELAKENKAKEEERFLNEQRAKVNRLANEINFYLKQINIIKESLQNQTDRKIIKAETEKINKYSKIIQKYKQELEKINNSIIIADSVVTDSIIKDSNIIKYLIKQARELRESIENILRNFPEIEIPKEQLRKLTPREEHYLTYNNDTFNQIPPEERDMAITAWIVSGRLGKNTLSTDKQSLHQEGNGANKSKIDINSKDKDKENEIIRELYKKFATTGEFHYDRNTGKNVEEYIEDAGFHIGYWKRKDEKGRGKRNITKIAYRLHKSYPKTII